MIIFLWVFQYNQANCLISQIALPAANTDRGKQQVSNIYSNSFFSRIRSSVEFVLQSNWLSQSPWISYYPSIFQSSFLSICLEESLPIFSLSMCVLLAILSFFSLSVSLFFSVSLSRSWSLSLSLSLYLSLSLSLNATLTLSQSSCSLVFHFLLLPI